MLKFELEGRVPAFEPGQVGRAESLIPCAGEARNKLEEPLNSDLTPEEFFWHVFGHANAVKTAEASLAKRGFPSRRNGRAELGPQG